MDRNPDETEETKITRANKAMTDKRWKRYELFKSFQETMEEIFKQFAKSDPMAQEFDNIYSLCICPRGRRGGRDTFLAEIFWGSRPYAAVETIHENRFKVETGATISFHLYDNGYVDIILNPAKAENLFPIEEAIFLHEKIHPKKLKNKRFLKCNWDAFMAYSATTSLDAKPSIWQLIISKMLLYTKRLLIETSEGKFEVAHRKFFTDLKKTLLIFFQGGFIIFILTQCTQSQRDKEVQEMSFKIQEYISGQSERHITINKSLDDINNELLQMSQYLSLGELEESNENITRYLEQITAMLSKIKLKYDEESIIENIDTK